MVDEKRARVSRGRGEGGTTVLSVHTVHSGRARNRGGEGGAIIVTHNTHAGVKAIVRRVHPFILLLRVVVVVVASCCCCCCFDSFIKRIGLHINLLLRSIDAFACVGCLLPATCHMPHAACPDWLQVHFDVGQLDRHSLAGTPICGALWRPEVATYLCPNSCVIVWESMMPLSSLTLHDCFGLHMPPTLASPSVLWRRKRRVA